MEKISMKINSKVDGLPLDTLLYECEDEPAKGVVQLCHGMCEHKERYIPFMKELCKNGYNVIIHDHRGHGGSVLSKDDLGFMSEGGHKALVLDTLAVNEFVHDKYPALPVYLFGHSMGSLVVRMYLKQYDRTIDGLIVCGSPSENPLAGVGKFLAKLIMLIRGEHYRSKFLDKLAFGSYNKNIAFPASEHSWICTDDAVVIEYCNDELCGFLFTANGFYNLTDMSKQVYEKRDWNVTKKELPIHFIAGESDPCIVSESAFKSAVNFLKARGYTNVTSKLYPKMRHEVLNEKGKEEVYSDVIAILNKFLEGLQRGKEIHSCS